MQRIRLIRRKFKHAECEKSLNEKHGLCQKLRYPGLALALTEQTTLELGEDSLSHASTCTLVYKIETRHEQKTPNNPFHQNRYYTIFDTYIRSYYDDEFFRNKL